MTIEKIKSEMKAYRDFWGGDLLGVDEIDACNTKAELKAIIDRHSQFMNDQENDAQGDLRAFSRKTGLNQVF